MAPGKRPAVGAADDAQSRYDDLLEISTRLFGEYGYDRTTVRMIADAMGVQSGSLYSHIESKQEVLRAIVLKAAEGVLAAVREALSTASTPEEQLRAASRAHLGVLHDHQAMVTVYFLEWHKLDNESRQRVITLRREYEQVFAGLLEEGIRRGDFNDVDLRATLLVLLAALNWAYTWYSPDGPLSSDVIADRFVDVILEGLRPRPGLKREARGAR